ncbi:hypothetical protein EBZ02_05190, partial [bacterium]|nr:hypothetical protein [bacterium]
MGYEYYRLNISIFSLLPEELALKASRPNFGLSFLFLGRSLRQANCGWQFGRVFGVALLLGTLFLPTALQAANGTWTNTGSTSATWSDTSNWSGGTVPGATSGTTSA